MMINENAAFFYWKGEDKWVIPIHHGSFTTLKLAGY